MSAEMLSGCCLLGNVAYLSTAREVGLQVGTKKSPNVLFLVLGVIWDSFLGK